MPKQNGFVKIFCESRLIRDCGTGATEGEDGQGKQGNSKFEHLDRTSMGQSGLMPRCIGKSRARGQLECFRGLMMEGFGFDRPWWLGVAMPHAGSYFCFVIQFSIFLRNIHKGIAPLFSKAL
jgi:hypothetical protein